MGLRSSVRPRHAVRVLPGITFALVICSGIVAAPLSAQAGLLTGWRPESGQRAALYAGYARHLEWHRQAGDTLTWYGWDVMAGPGQGLFVDGTFGAPFAALDERVDPRGDAEDHAINVDAFASPAWREALLLRPDLSTTTALEARVPTAYAQVVRYTVGAATGTGFAAVETALRGMAWGRPPCSGGLLPYTVYESIAGSSAPGFIVMVWRDRLGSFDDDGANPVPCLRQLVASPTSPASSAGVVVSIEVWRLRRDLSYMGSADREEAR